MFNIKVVTSTNTAEFEKDVDYWIGQGYHVVKYCTEMANVTVVSNGGYHSENIQKIQYIAFMESTKIFIKTER